MYSSRGIGRQSYGDRRPNEKPGGGPMPDRSPYQDSPNGNYWPNDREIDRKPNLVLCSERKDVYRNSPDGDNSYQSSSRDGYTPPGPPPLPPGNPSPVPPPPSTPNPNIAPKATPGPVAVPYTPNPYASPNVNQTPNYNSNSSYRPNPPPSQYNSYSNSNPKSSYGRDYDGEDRPLTEKEIEEKIFEEKLKVLFTGVNSIDDLITLKEQYISKAESLDAIIAKSKLREGDILRNKRRDRTDWKDPMMIETRKLQEDVKKKLLEVNRYQVEIDKRIRAYNKAIKDQIKAKEEEMAREGGDKPSNYEVQLLQNSVITTTAEDDEEEEEEDEYEFENLTKEYFDPGQHWCRDCDKLVPKIAEFFDHLHTKEHWKLFNNELQPWKKSKKAPPLFFPDGRPVPRNKTRTAIKGAQFLIPLKGFYCPHCKEYLADNAMAEEHMKSAKHNRIYNRFTCLNIDYEHKWNIDKGKALSRHQVNERKRLKEEEQKELEKKRFKEELKIKEEKDLKKKKREEESKRKEKEERERERDDYKKNKSNSNVSSAERFRLKGVTLDLNDKKDSKSSHKDKDRGREREVERHKKRKRIYSSDSSSDASPPPKKRQTYFGDPYKDPKLKLKSFVPLDRLNRKTAKRYQCEDLLKVIEDAKTRKDKPVVISDPKPNSPLKMEIDIHNYDETDNKAIKSTINDIISGLDDPSEEKESRSEPKDDSKSDNKEISEKEVQNKSSEKSDDKEDSVREEDISPDSGEDNGVRDDSIDSESKLQIDLTAEKESTGDKADAESGVGEEKCSSEWEEVREPQT